MRKNLFIVALGLLATNAYTQVTIGLGEEAIGGSLLQLKSIEDTHSNGDVNSTKGIAFPRVKLTHTHQLYPMYSNNTDYQINKKRIDANHKGLMVYNVGNENTFAEGVYFWSGSQWMTLESNVSIPPAITSLICSNTTFDRQTLKENEYFETYARVPYHGGNGGVYLQGPEISSTGVTGLKAQLQEGKLANGAGELVYRIWGTPNKSTPNTAIFDISFPTGFDSNNNPTYAKCVIELGNTSYAKIETVSVVGPLVYTEDNNVPGFGREITSPDGKWSMRVFVPKGGVNYKNYGGSGTSVDDNDQFEDCDIQLRPNNIASDKKIMFTVSVLWKGGYYEAHTTGVLNIPASSSNNWGGTTASIGDATDIDKWYKLHPTTTKSKNNEYYHIGWHNTNVFQSDTPENRIYTWTEIGEDIVGQKKRSVYTVTFMMGVAKNPENEVDENNAAYSTVYLKMEQTTSME